MVSDAGFVRFSYKNQVFSVADVDNTLVEDVENVDIVVDRLVVRPGDESFETRFRDSLLLTSEKTS